MAAFKRDMNKYVVIKTSDALKYLSIGQQKTIEECLMSIATQRAEDGRNPRLRCVVVEDDWSIYDKVWELVEE